MVLRKSRVRATALLVVGAMVLSMLPAPAGAEGQESPRAENVDWVMEGDDMIVSYDLAGELDRQYEVSLVLRRSGDPSFRVVPVRVSGDFGDGKFAGPGRTIRWRILEDLGVIPEGNDYYVELTVEEPDELPWFLVVVGVAVSGATIYSLVQADEQAGPPPISELPGPPSRP